MTGKTGARCTVPLAGTQAVIALARAKPVRRRDMDAEPLLLVPVDHGPAVRSPYRFLAPGSRDLVAFGGIADAGVLGLPVRGASGRDGSI
ncbi:MAG: hypothetical protein ACREOC_16225 [Gemmatimonadales bacterium]